MRQIHIQKKHGRQGKCYNKILGSNWLLCPGLCPFLYLINSVAFQERNFLTLNFLKNLLDEFKGCGT